mmetsp:Transcript_31234/g.44886  ORF Transcript_31234/g.44886 Transcript_31234/m.44886 type:complete len:432 (-) Transcript_31234:403-1698(-)
MAKVAAVAMKVYCTMPAWAVHREGSWSIRDRFTALSRQNLSWAGRALTTMDHSDTVPDSSVYRANSGRLSKTSSHTRARAITRHNTSPVGLGLELTHDGNGQRGVGEAGPVLRQPVGIDTGHRTARVLHPLHVRILRIGRHYEGPGTHHRHRGRIHIGIGHVVGAGGEQQAEGSHCDGGHGLRVHRVVVDDLASDGLEGGRAVGLQQRIGGPRDGPAAQPPEIGADGVVRVGGQHQRVVVQGEVAGFEACHDLCGDAVRCEHCAHRHTHGSQICIAAHVFAEGHLALGGEPARHGGQLGPQPLLQLALHHQRRLQQSPGRVQSHAARHEYLRHHPGAYAALDLVELVRGGHCGTGGREADGFVVGLLELVRLLAQRQRHEAAGVVHTYRAVLVTLLGRVEAAAGPGDVCAHTHTGAINWNTHRFRQLHWNI